MRCIDSDLLYVRSRLPSFPYFHEYQVRLHRMININDAPVLPEYHNVQVASQPNTQRHHKIDTRAGLQE